MNIPIFPMEQIYKFVIETDKSNATIYKGRGQSNPFRRLQQNLIGKIGEMYIDWYFNGDNRIRILENTGMGQHRSDIICMNRGMGIKTQDKASADAFGANRFVFSEYDKFKSDIYCGLIIDPKTKSKSTDFKEWYDSIMEIGVEWSFCCKRDVLLLDVWEEASSYLKGKRILCVSKIPAEYRLDLKDKFPIK